ncbi:MAG: beta-ketoacyl synthase N-terminal-like domain-containing protein, partial [Gammaproteobacteria bacterium]
ILFEQAGRIVGFALSQRIDSSAALRQVSAAALPPAHAPTGHALLLLACAAPSDPVRAALLAALRALAQRSGIGALALVGWCMHAQAQSAQDFHGYLATALRSGWTSEPALEAHVRQGARVLGFIEDYRPAAAPHFGYGVLLEYEIEAVTEAPQPLERRMRAITRQYPEVVPLALTGEGPLTFWIHPMSGDVGMYNRLAARMGGAIRMIGLRARGFLVAERAPIADLVEMARYYAECIVALEPHGPYHLAGFSVGGTIAYEVARQLQLQGKSVRSLVMVEAPLLSEQDRPLFQSSARNNLLVNANFLLVTLLSMDPAFKKALENREVAWKDVQIDDSEIADVADADVLGRLVQLCLKRDVKLSADEVAFKLASMADVHMANLQATQRYQGERLPRAHEVNAFVFRTREGKVASSILRNPEYIERVQAAHGSLLPLLTAWSALLPGLSTVLLDGDDHFDILRSKEGMQKFCARCIEIFGAAAPQPPATAGAPATEAVAIIGMSGRFPGAPDVHRFWDNLKQGVSSIAEAPSDRGWHIDQYFDPVAQTPGKSYSKWGGFLSDVDQFDPLFFGIAPREAEVMDPSERIFLQECWRAIEDAGYAPARISGRPWGVFATAKGDYAYHIHKSHDTYLAPTDSSGPARVSYLLNLVGPAVSVDTACSSTLTAVAYACDSLVLGNCEVAIAGGGGIYSTPNFFVASSQSLLFSPDGVCAPFDHRANGTVMGEAVGVVVLKLLKHALRDGDPIHGVIRGWATNQDGKTNGMTAPSVTSQTRLQSHVYKKFGIDCARIGMVESHGTGTRLGDPIEVQALTASFREATAQVGYCALGAVKGNIGHAFAGAGVTALIKTLLCLKHGQIPPNLNFEKPNPFVKIDGSPFYINTELRDWPQGQGPRCAAINSFGATGINAHLVVEEFTPGERA